MSNDNKNYAIVECLSDYEIIKRCSKKKMQKLGDTLADLVKIRRQDVDVKDTRETHT